MLLIYFGLSVLALSFWYNYRQWAYKKFARQIGGPPGYPLIGNALDFINNMDRSLVTLSKFIDEFGDRLVFFFGPWCVILVNNVEDMEKICTSTELIEKSDEYDLARDFLGEGLVTSKGQLWAHRRKFITPCFHFSILETFIDPINAHASILVDILREKFENAEDFLDIKPFIWRCTLDIICETSMGIQMKSQRESYCAYVEATERIGQLFQYRSIRPWLRNDFLWSLTSQAKEERKILHIVHSFTEQVIADRKQTLLAGSEVENPSNSLQESSVYGRIKKPLLDLMLEEQAKNPEIITDKGIQEETTTFIFAGHDTVSVAISFCLHALGNHPEVQAKLHQELDTVFEDDPSRPVSLSDLKRLKYLELCIKETLRLYPSVPYIGRIARKPFRLDENTVIPAGVGVHFFPYKLHRNPKYWPKANQFIPERFDLGFEGEFGKVGKNPFAYIPFSAGPRNCVGQKLAMMEVKIVLATVLRKFKIRSELLGEELQLLTEITLGVVEGLHVKLELR